jgi:type II secretory pathway component GspD/PulD (secretin)
MVERRNVHGWAMGAFLAGALLPAAAAAGEPQWPPGVYKYVVIDQDLRDALIEFGRNVHIPMEVSDRIKGRVRGPLPGSTAQEFLQRLCASYGLVGYFDGTRLHINSENELKTQLVKVDRTPLNDLLPRLQQLGIVDPRYPVKASSEAGMVAVSGPPAYVALVARTLAEMTKTSATVRETEGGDEKRVRVYRGSSSTLSGPTRFG